MTTLHITVGDRDTIREETLEFVRDAESGKGGDTEDADVEGRSTLQFGSYDDLVDTLTPLRLELVRATAKHEPESMRAAARLVERDISDVHSDLKRLEVVGILDLEEGHGGAMRPVVPFDRIEVSVDYPLVDGADTDESPASA
jgi:predicted transcriptional regulator